MTTNLRRIEEKASRFSAGRMSTIESDKTLTASDIPEEMLSKLNNTDLFNDFEWEIISYDYDEKAQDMAYFELIVEDRKVITLSMDEYGITWSLGDKENKWVYQVIINGDVHQKDNHLVKKTLCR